MSPSTANGPRPPRTIPNAAKTRAARSLLSLSRPLVEQATPFDYPDALGTWLLSALEEASEVNSPSSGRLAASTGAFPNINVCL
jgi:hypothetical protein